MNLRKNFWVAAIIIPLIFLPACDNNTSTHTPTPYYPGCSVSTLIGHINFANGDTDADIIHLEPWCTYTLRTAVDSIVINNQTHHSGLPNITTDITIYGHHTSVIEVDLDPGEPPIGHFNVDGLGDAEGDLKLYDLTLQNGLRQIGGAVIVHQADLFASFTSFLDNGVGPMDLNNIQPGLGGAIYNLAGSVTIINGSAFRDNYASQPPDQTDDLGGAIYNKNGDLVVYSSRFATNLTAGKGGAIYSEKDSANQSGGSIIIENSDFIANQASLDGGAIALVNETNGATFITDSNISGNEAGGSGGAIYAEGSELIADLDRFVQNSAAYGGTIYSKGSGGGNPGILSSSESTYDGSFATDIGGAIYSENADLFLDENLFENNTANSCGAIRIGGHSFQEGEGFEPGAELSTDLYIPSIIEISESNFINNEATLTHGGGICHMQGELSIQGTMFKDNNAKKYGGGLFLYDKSELTDVRLVQNSARFGGGAAIGYPGVNTVQIPGESDLVDPATLNFSTQIVGSEIVTNITIGPGAGLYVNVGGRVSISKSTFSYNTANSAGGGIYQYGGDLRITNSTFSANSATKGGGLYANECTVTYSATDIKHSTFAHNAASNPQGGGGLNYRGDVNVQNTLVSQNSDQDCGTSQCNSSNITVPGSVDSDGSCAFPVTVADPKIGPLSYNGGATNLHPLQPNSPLINTAPDCANLTDDQRAVPRPLPDPGDCDPGSYEFDTSNPPTMTSMQASPTPDPEISTLLPCDLFEGLQYSLILSNIAQETGELTLSIKLAEGSLAFWNGLGEAAYFASLGDVEAEGFQEEGYPGRIYFNFALPGSAAGSVQDFQLFRDDCEDLLVSIPGVSIPEPDSPDSGQPSLTCKKGLDKDSCEKAGGTYVDHGLAAPPECVCP